MKILLIGPYPPPLGGVSIYIKRYKCKMLEKGHKVDVLDIGKLPRIQYCIKLFITKFMQYDIIQINIFSFNIFMFLFVLGLLKKAQLIIHNCRQMENLNKIKIRLLSAFLNQCKELVLVAPHLEAYYKEKGVILTTRISIQNAFIPPLLEEERAILKTYPPDIYEFVQQRYPLLIANAFEIVFYKGVDLYGLDMCVELIAEIKKKYPKIGLLFALPEIGEQNYYKKINQKINELKIRKNFCFMTGQKELWPLFKKANLMIRPTYSDGYAISIAEALYFNCPIVASDVCKRPESTVLFRNRDLEDFIITVKKTLDQKQ